MGKPTPGVLLMVIEFNRREYAPGAEGNVTVKLSQ